MKILVLLFIFSSLVVQAKGYSLSPGILTELDTRKLSRYEGKFDEFMNSEKSYNTALDYMNNNKKELEFLKKELEKLDYRYYEPSLEYKELMLTNIMSYMKLLTIDVLYNFRTGNKVKVIQSLEYQIKFFKVVLKRDVLLNHMIVVANEIALFKNLKKFLKKDNKDIKRIIERYSVFRKDQFEKSLKGELAFMKKEFLKADDLGKEFSFLNKKDYKKIIDYITKKENIRVEKILLGFKNNESDDYFKKLDKNKDNTNLKAKIFRAYLTLGISAIFRDPKKPYQAPRIYLEVIGDILLGIGGVSASGYNGYYKKERESLGLMKDILK